MTLVLAVELVSPEEKLLLTLKVPLDQAAVFRTCDDRLVVERPVEACYSLFVTFDEMFLEVVFGSNNLFFLLIN